MPLNLGLIIRLAPPSSLSASDPCPLGGLMIALKLAFEPVFDVNVTVAYVYSDPTESITTFAIVFDTVLTRANALAPVPSPVIEMDNAEFTK